MPPSGQTERHADRKQKALDLRIAGARYRAIGKELGISTSQAWKLVAEGLRETATKTAESAETLRALELERCDRMTLGLWTQARQGNTRSVLAAIKVAERRAKLAGLDAPQVVGTFDASDKQQAVKRISDETLRRLLADLDTPIPPPGP